LNRIKSEVKIALGSTKLADVCLVFYRFDLFIREARARLAVPVFAPVAHHELAIVDLTAQKTLILIVLLLFGAVVADTLGIVVPVALLQASNRCKFDLAVEALNAVSAVPLALVYAVACASKVYRLVTHATHRHVFLVPWLAALLTSLAVRTLPVKAQYQFCHKWRVAASRV